jgi:hypothetical protein
MKSNLSCCVFNTYSWFTFYLGAHSVSFTTMQKHFVDAGQTKSHVIKVIEGFETVTFKSKFREWPAAPELKLSAEDGRGKVAGYCLQFYLF